jgi:hypothetical protein
VAPTAPRWGCRVPPAAEHAPPCLSRPLARLGTEGSQRGLGGPQGEGEGVQSRGHAQFRRHQPPHTTARPTHHTPHTLRPTTLPPCSYKIYLFKVLKQVHPDTGISSKSMAILNSEQQGGCQPSPAPACLPARPPASSCLLLPLWLPSKPLRRSLWINLIALLPATPAALPCRHPCRRRLHHRHV